MADPTPSPDVEKLLAELPFTPAGRAFLLRQRWRADEAELRATVELAKIDAGDGPIDAPNLLAARRRRLNRAREERQWGDR